MTDIAYQAAAEIPLTELAPLFTDSFTGYIAGSVQMSVAGLAAMLARDNIDLNASMVAVEDGRLLGFGMIARQGWSSRLAAMGISQAAQGKKVGFHLLTHLLDQARSRGDQQLWLEAFEQNVRAVKLYEKGGFEIVRRLYGYNADQLAAGSADGLTAVDTYEAARVIIAHGAADLPWQVAGAAMARATPLQRAYRLGEAWAVITDPSAETIAIRSLLVHPNARGRGEARRLLESLGATFPAKKWLVPAICPEEHGGFFERHGFTRQALNQLQMRVMLV